jgi:hypothetical protein
LEIQDPTGWLNPVRIAELCGPAGLPAPGRVTFIGGVGRCAVYSMKFPTLCGIPHRALWVELATGVRGSALHACWAAHQCLEFAADVGEIPGFIVPPNYRLGKWTAVRHLGRPVFDPQWIERHPQHWGDMGRQLGHRLTQLHDTSFPHHGFRPEGGRFVPMHASWRDEWCAYVDALCRRAVMTGVDMGGLLHRLSHQIESRLAALDEVDDWTLVHGNLGIQSIELTPRDDAAPEVGLTSWDDAMIGDPCVDVGALLGMTPQQLAPILSGLDRDVVEHWLASEQTTRIEVYHLTWVLSQLCAIGDYCSVERGTSRFAALGRFRRHLDVAFDTDFCRSRLERALKLSDRHNPSWAFQAPDPVEDQIDVVFGLIGCDPSVPAHQLLGAASLLGACLVVKHIGDEHTAIRQRCLAVATHDDFAACGRPSASGAVVEDKEAWLQGLSDDIEAGLSQDMVDSSAIVFWWVCLEAMERVEHNVSLATLQGMERLIRGAMYLARLQRGAARRPLAKQLAHAILGLGAIHGVRRLRNQPNGLEELRHQYQEVLQEAAIDLDLLRPAVLQADWSIDEALRCLERPVPHPEVGWLQPLLLHSFLSMHGEEALPNGPLWVSEQIGRHYASA